MIYSREFVFNDIDYKVEVTQGKYCSNKYIVVLKSIDPDVPEKGYTRTVCSFACFEDMDTLSGILSTILVPDVKDLAKSLNELDRWDKKENK